MTQLSGEMMFLPRSEPITSSIRVQTVTAKPTRSMQNYTVPIIYKQTNKLTNQLTNLADPVSSRETNRHLSALYGT
jgi:hypothetical protein